MMMVSSMDFIVCIWFLMWLHYSIKSKYINHKLECSRKMFPILHKKVNTLIKKIGITL
jgi:hypothetical protein